MASTYVNNLRLEEIGSGEQSGTWGDTTNTNLEIIGQAVAWGTRAIANASTDNITIADGALDADRCLGLKLTGGGQACTVTLLPNTSSKTWIMYNATSYDLTFTCGSGANVIIPAGNTKVIATDGLGSGGVVHDLLTSLNVASNLYVKNAGTGDGSTANIYLQTAEADIAADDVIGKINFQAPNEGTGTDAILVSAAIQAKSEGDFSSSNNATSLNFMTGASEAAATKMTLTSGGDLKLVTDSAVLGFGADNDTTLTHTDGSGLTLNSTNKIMFNDTSQFIQGSSATVLSIAATDEIDLTATAIDLNGTLDVSGTALVTGVLTTTAATVHNGGITMPDNAKAIFGAGSDLQIYHDASHSYIVDDGTGNMYISTNGNGIVMQASLSETMFVALPNGATSLYYDNAAKIATASGGVTVTGEMAATTMDLSSNAVIDGTALVTGVLTTTAATVFNGGFASNADSTMGTDKKLFFRDSAIHISSTADGDLSIAADDEIDITSTLIDVNGNLDVSGTFALGGDLTTAADANIIVQGTHNEGGALLDLKGTDTPASGKNLGSLSFGNSTDRSLAMIRSVSEASDAADLRFFTEATGTTIEERFRIASDGSLSTPTAGTSNVRFGVNAGNSIASGGNYNVAVGDEAGTAISTGDQNTLVGYRAGTAVNTSINNVAVGMDSMLTNTTGDNNIAVGREALKRLTTTNNNVAVGSESLKETITGTQNVAVGHTAGQHATTADNSTFIGFQAGQGIDGVRLTGNDNTAVGASAGLLLQGAAVQNTIIGALAGDALTTASFNVAVGTESLGICVLGSRNTAIGSSALGNANPDSAVNMINTAVGYAAGYNVTTGTNNLLLGNDSGRSTAPSGTITTGSNIICLGNDNIEACHVEVDWSIGSDQRDKTDFTALDLGLDFVKDLAPVTYKWDKRSKYGDKTADDYDLNAQTPDGTHKEDWLDIGFKAQEVEALEIAAGYNKSNKTNLIASHTEDGKRMTLQYSKFIPILVKAMQEQNALIEALTARIVTLEG